MPPIKYVYMQNFMFVGVLVIEFNRKKMKNMAKLYYTSSKWTHKKEISWEMIVVYVILSVLFAL